MKLEETLHCWREVLAVSQPLIMWTTPAAPGIITSLVSLVFLLIWYYDPTLLVLTSFLCMCLVLADFAVLHLRYLLIGREAWNDNHQNAFAEVCSVLHRAVDAVNNGVVWLMEMKREKPSQYCVVVSACLSCVAYVGSSINNLFLSYLAVLFVCLLPGLLACGHLCRGTAFCGEFVSKLLNKPATESCHAVKKTD